MDVLSIVTRMAGQASVAGWQVNPFMLGGDDSLTANTVMRMNTNDSATAYVKVKILWKRSPSGRWIYHKSRLLDAMGKIHAIHSKAQLIGVLGIEPNARVTDLELVHMAQDVVLHYVKKSGHSQMCKRCQMDMRGHTIVRIGCIDNLTTSMWIHRTCIRTQHAEDEF